MLHMLIGFLAFAIGAFALSNIFFPILFTFPRIQKLKKTGNFEEKAPVYKLFIAPIIWISLLAIVLIAVNNNYEKYFVTAIVGLGIAIIGVIHQAITKKSDMIEDFNRVWGKYIKK